MSINLKSDKKEYQVIEEGSYIARLYSIVELGNLPLYNKPGESARKVMFTFELPEETREFNGEVKPMAISADYFISMYKTSQLRKAVEGIAGKLDDSEAEEFDLKSLLGKSCMVNVTHTVSKNNGRTYANIASIMPLPKGVKDVPKQHNPSVFFSYAEFGQEIYNALPAWVQKKMADSEEMKSRNKHPENDFNPEEIPF